MHQGGPKSDPNFDEDMEDQEIDELFHNLIGLCTSRKKRMRATRDGRGGEKRVGRR